MTTNFLPVVVPAIPPRPPVITLIGSSVRPADTGNDPSGLFVVGADVLDLLPTDAAQELLARQGEAWIRGLTYAPENHGQAIPRDPCDGTSVDLPALAAPLGVATVPHATGGTLAAATYHYQVTAVNANGETTAIAAVAAVVGGAGAGSVTINWTKDASYVQYNVYGRSGTLGLLATVGPFDDQQAATYVDTGAATPGVAVPVTNTTGGPGSYVNTAIVKYLPPLFQVEDFCSTFGWEERDFVGRAKRLLENAKYSALEREFWTGALATAKGYPNNYLTNNTTSPNFEDVTPGTVPSIKGATRVLQNALATSGFGGQGMLHMEAQAAPDFLGARRVGAQFLDQFDNIVVPGSGYTGTAPGGGAASAGTTWLYATDLVMTREEPFDERKHIYPNTIAEALDRGEAGQPNTIRYRAQKCMAAYWDGARHFACQANLDA